MLGYWDRHTVTVYYEVRINILQYIKEAVLIVETLRGKIAAIRKCMHVTATEKITTSEFCLCYNNAQVFQF